MSKNVNLQLINDVLSDYYGKRLSMTKIAKTRKVSMTQVKKIISDYSEVFLNKYPNLKHSNVSKEAFRAFLEKRPQRQEALQTEHVHENSSSLDSLSSFSSYC
jgi:predicted DNA-binding protein YlxM (UPF0122 family)